MGFSVQLARLFLGFKRVCAIGDSTQSSAPQGTAAPAGTTLPSEAAAEEPNPGGHLPSSHPWLADTPAAKRRSPAWQGGQGSSAGAGLIHPFQPWLEDAVRNQAGSPLPHPCLFWTAATEAQSLLSFRSPRNAEKSQERDKPHQNGRVFSKPLARSPPEP